MAGAQVSSSLKPHPLDCPSLSRTYSRSHLAFAPIPPSLGSLPPAHTSRTPPILQLGAERSPQHPPLPRFSGTPLPLLPRVTSYNQALSILLLTLSVLLRWLRPAAAFAFIAHH